MNLQILNLDGTSYIKFEKFLNKDIAFSNVLGSGQVGLSIELDYKEFDLIGKFAKLNIGHKIVYAGVITNERIDFYGKTTLKIMGIFELFNRFDRRILYSPYQATITYLANRVSSMYPVFELIHDIEGSDRYTPENTSYKLGTQIIRESVDGSGNDFFIGADQVIHFKKNISEKIHYLRIGIDAEITGGFIGQDMGNYVCTGTGIVDNPGYRETIINEEERDIFGDSSRINRVPSGRNAITNIIEARRLLQSPQKKTQLEITKNFWDIEVGDYVTVENSPVKIERVKIVKIDFSLTRATIYLDAFSNIYTNLKK